MDKVLCIKKVQKDLNKEENFSKGTVYDIFDIDVDYYDKTSLQLEILNNQNVSNPVACITADIENVKNEDWYDDAFFKEHFVFVDK